MRLGGGGWGEPWREHGTGGARWTVERVLSDGACAMGKRQAWDMARAEEKELKVVEPGRVQ